MKKILIFLMALCVLLPHSDQAFASNESYTVQNVTGLTIYEDLIDFVYGDNIEENKRVDRTVGTNGEKLAAEYITTQFETLGLDKFFDDYTYEFRYSQGIFSESGTSRNVVGFQPSTINPESQKFIIIGAHMDNAYGMASSTSTKTLSHGVYDNASGIVAMLNIAEQLMSKNLPYNVMYVAFGGEELGQLGSQDLLNKLSKTQKENMLLMINLDSIGSGDELYLYADEVSTKHETFFKGVSDAVSSQLGYEKINLPPDFKKATYINSFTNISYSHMGLASDNGTFVDGGYNTITFFSGDWNGANFGITESSKNDNIYHTSKDNITKIDELYGESFYNKIATVVNVVVNATTQESFESIVLEKNTSSIYRFFTNALYIKLICAGLVVGLFFIVKTIAKKKNGKDYSALRDAVLNNNIDEINGDLPQ